MDYKALLTKYIAHLHEVEGADFIDTGRHSEIVFTDDERCTFGMRGRRRITA